MAAGVTMPKATVQTTLRVAQDIYERMAKGAKAAGVSINEWASRAIVEKADRDAITTRQQQEGRDDG